MTGECEWRHAQEARAEDFGDLRKVSKLSSCVRTEKLRFRLHWGEMNLCATGAARWLSFSVRRRRLTFRVRRDQTCSLQWGAAHGGGRWKYQHRMIVYHSPYIELPLNSKVIKSFVPELRSRKCFLCFEIPMLSIYELRTFYIYFTYSCMAM